MNFRLGEYVDLIQYHAATSRVLDDALVPPTKVFPRLAVNKTISKPRIAAATGAQYLYVGFSDVIKFRVAAHMISVQTVPSVNDSI